MLPTCRGSALVLWDTQPEELDGYFPELRELVMDASSTIVPTATSQAAPCAGRSKMAQSIRSVMILPAVEVWGVGIIFFSQ